MAAIYEFTYSRRRVGEWDGRRSLTSPEEAALFFAPMFEGLEREHVIVAALTRKHRPIGVETVYRGTVAGCTIRLAEVVALAVRTGAPALLVAHNHPSGDPSPSAEDLRTTRDLVAAGRLLGIDVLDHIVIGDPGWISIGQQAAGTR